MRTPLVVVLCLALGMPGCATFQRRQMSEPAPCVPPHILDAPRSSREPINYLALRLGPEDQLRIGPEDVLGIYVEGVLGDPEAAPPVLTPQQEHLPPAVGFPVTVRQDGTIALPLIPPVHVVGLTMQEAEDAIRAPYLKREILNPGQDRVIVTMMRLRTYHVLVIRQDATAPLTAGRVRRPDEVILEPEKRGRAFSLELPAYRNDVLHALTESGGLPGADAQPYVVVLRGYERDPAEMRSSDFLDRLLTRLDDTEEIAAPETLDGPLIPAPSENLRVLRIPLMQGPGLPSFNLTEEQIKLEDGDVIVVESRESEVFYTGGLLEGGQHPIPRDYDLDVLGAIAMAGGSVAAAAGGSGTVRFGGAAGTVFPPTRVTIVRIVNGVQVPIEVDLRRALIDPSERVLIQPNDFILLEYTPREAVANLLLNNVLISLSGPLWD